MTRWTIALAIVALAACAKSTLPEGGSQTHFLCDHDDDCDELGTGFECTEGGFCQEVAPASAAVNQTALTAICDGSDDMRFGYTHEGGRPGIDYELTQPYGYWYLFIDGQCRGYAWHRDAFLGVRTMQLDQPTIQRIAAEVGWQSLPEASEAEETTPCDGAGYHFWVPGYHVECSCGCEPGPLVNQVVTAFGKMNGLIVELSQHADRLDTPIDAIAIDMWASSNGMASPWPLARDAIEVPGLVQDAATVDWNAPMILDDVDELAVLRAIPHDPPFSHVTIPFDSQGRTYMLYLHEQLPEGVQEKIDALRASSLAP